jgi:hypothetical protein
MAMNRESFNSLCAGVAAALFIDDASAVERGDVFFVDGIECQLVYMTERGGALANFELGDPQPGTELELYRQLFEIQSMLVAHMEALFIRDPINDSMLFTVRIALADAMDAATIAGVLRSLATQVRRWRDTVMRGQFVDYEALAEDVMNGEAGLSMMEV